LNALQFEHFCNFDCLNFERSRTAACPSVAEPVDSPAVFGTADTDFDTIVESDFE
jgi:hypothetical protein